MKTNRVLMTPAAAGAFVLCGTATHAAVIGIDSITGSPAFASATTAVSTESLLSSVTIGSETYSELLGAAASNLSGGTAYFYQNINPGSAAAAISGLSLTTAAPNYSADYKFTGLNATPDTLFFVFEIGGDNSFGVTAIDANGSAIAGGSLTLATSNYGPLAFTANNPNRSNSPTPASNPSPTYGVAFTLVDLGFSETPAGFAGFRLNAGGTADPVLVGAVIPEPASLGLIAAGSLLMLRRRAPR